MYYVLILQSHRSKRFHYIEYTETAPEERLKLHNSGEVKKTENRVPLEIDYYEAYKSKEEAIHRTNSLKLYSNAWAQLKRRIEKSLE